ncbi:MAG: hypothetical protein AVDCRST_MAG30-2812, partial [uncultured Solirubrobacteraceae bacterium]
ALAAAQGSPDPPPLAAAGRAARDLPDRHRGPDRLLALQSARQAARRLRQPRPAGGERVQRGGRAARRLELRGQALRGGRAAAREDAGGGDPEGARRRRPRRAGDPRRRGGEAAQRGEPVGQPPAPDDRGLLQRRGPAEAAVRRVAGRLAARGRQPGAHRRAHEARGAVHRDPPQGWRLLDPRPGDHRARAPAGAHDRRGLDRLAAPRRARARGARAGLELRQARDRQPRPLRRGARLRRRAGAGRAGGPRGQEDPARRVRGRGQRDDLPDVRDAAAGGRHARARAGGARLRAAGARPGLAGRPARGEDRAGGALLVRGDARDADRPRAVRRPGLGARAPVDRRARDERDRVRGDGGGDRRARPRGPRRVAAGVPALAADRVPGARPEWRGRRGPLRRHPGRVGALPVQAGARRAQRGPQRRRSGPAAPAAAPRGPHARLRCARAPRAQALRV